MAIKGLKPAAALFAKYEALKADVDKTDQTIATKTKQLDEAREQLKATVNKQPVVIDVEADAAADALLANPKGGFTDSILSRFRNRKSNDTLGEWQAQVAGLKAAVKRGEKVIADCEAALPQMRADRDQADREWKAAASAVCYAEFLAAAKVMNDTLLITWASFDNEAQYRAKLYDLHAIKPGSTGMEGFPTLRLISPGFGGTVTNERLTRARADFEAELRRLAA